MEHCQNITELLNTLPINKTIVDNAIIAWSKINSPLYKNIICSISGGADSDIMLDICYKCDKDNKIKYVWFDTGLEYQATKDHLVYLENKYSIKIKRYKADKPVSVCCKNIGQPFLSKQVSDMISRLQKHNFKWEDKDFDTLLTEYPNCKSALKWWCNAHEHLDNKFSKFDIGYNKWLKEFLIKNPPLFKISSKCCDYAKKKPAHRIQKQSDLAIIGVRKSEGGIRSSSYKSCFSCEDDYDNYRPLFWYLASDKLDYKNYCNILYSDCYEKYGLSRTGCCGCPFGKDFEYELKVAKQFEPNLYKAINVFFKDSYEYTRRYKQFKLKMDEISSGKKKLF